MGKIKDYASSAAKLSDKILTSDADTGDTKNLLISDIVALTNVGNTFFYRALLTQDTEDAPTAVELPGNTITGIEWTRTTDGDYNGLKVGAFTGIVVMVAGTAPAYGIPQTFQIDRVDDDNIRLRTAVSGGLADDALANQYVQIMNIV
jgi:hypothetical protein